MILACTTYLVVIFCGERYNYVHHLTNGKQEIYQTEYKVEFQDWVIEETKKLYPDSKMIPQPNVECGCPIPPEGGEVMRLIDGSTEEVNQERPKK